MQKSNQDSNLAILIPTLNEELAIKTLIKDCKKITEKVIVIDGLSSDRTIEFAEQSGADILRCEKKGKGFALIHGFKHILNVSDVSYVAYLDGDNTYDPEDIRTLYLEIQNDHDCDLLIGNRFPKREKGTITRLNMIGNKIFSKLVSKIVKQKITDTQSGLRVMSKEVIEFLSNSLESKNFEIETEMIIKTAKKGFKIGEIPIRYSKRDGETKLNPLQDGFRILRTIIRSAIENN